MGWSQLAKAVAWVALAAFVVWGIYFIVTSIKSHYYDQGVADTDLKWEAREREIELATAREKSRISEAAERSRALLLGSLQNEQAKNQKLSGDIIDLKIAGLYIDASACDKKYSSGGATDSSTGDGGGRLTTIRLPASNEESLSTITKHAQICVNKYHTLRDIVKGFPNVVIVPKAQ